MASIVTNLTCELTAPVSVVFLPGNMFSMDNGGNIINVFVVQNGEPVALGGSVSANVIRSDGTTVAITGALEGNKAYIILPQACYAVPGIIHIVMKITEGTTITTIAAVTANVYQSSTDAVVDPGTLVPSIAALIEAIEDAVDSIPVDYSGLLATLAADYSTSKTYKVGDYAWYGGVLKRCIVAITTAESYNAAHWTNAVIGDDLSALKSAITENKTYADWESGGLNPANGGNTTSAARIRLTKYVGINNNIPSALALTGYEFSVNAWNNSTGAYVGVYTTGNAFATSGTAKWMSSFNFAAYPGYKFRVVLRNAVTTTASISTSEATNCVFSVNRFDTDKTLTKEHVAADAKVTGDAITNTDRNERILTDVVGEKVMGKILVIDPPVTSQIVDGSGNISDSQNTNLTGFIELPQNKTLYVSFAECPENESGTLRSAYYSAANNSAFLSRETVSVSNANKKNIQTLALMSSGAKYVRYCYEKKLVGIEINEGTLTVNDIKNVITTSPGVNIIPLFGNKANGKTSGVDFTWSNDKWACTVDGENDTSNPITRTVLTMDISAFGEIRNDDGFIASADTTNDAVRMYVYFYNENNTFIRGYSVSASVFVKIPANAVSMAIRIGLEPNSIADDDVISNISFCKMMNGYEDVVDDYDTLFFDDFNTFDESVWSRVTEAPRSGTGEEPGAEYASRFYTTEDNAYTANSCLVLKCYKGDSGNNGYYKGKDGDPHQINYLASYVSCGRKLAIPKGRFSARMKFSSPIGQASFPGGFWTFGQNERWSYAHEMDVGEFIQECLDEARDVKGNHFNAGSVRSTFSSHIHTANDQGEDVKSYKYLSMKYANWNGTSYDQDITTYSVLDFDASKWHIYSVEWDENTINIYIDGNLFVTYDAETVGACDRSGNTGFFYPQDIRFNIKKAVQMIEGDVDEGYLFVDWVKAEVKNLTPCTSITHADISIAVGQVVYINPVFNTNCSNVAFAMETEDESIITVAEKETSRGNIAHRITGKSAGTATVKLTSANGKAESTFTVTVS